MAQGLRFDLKLHHPTADLIQLGGHRIMFDAQTRRRLVDEVDRLVGEETVGDVTVARNRRRDNGGIGDANAVMRLIAILSGREEWRLYLQRSAG